MRCKTIYGSTLLLLLLGAAGYGQSLGELAKKEKERREQVKAQARVITNVEAAKFKTAPVTIESPAPAVAPKKEGSDKDSTSASAAKKSADDEPTDFQGRPESFWRQTMGDARKKVKELENEANVLVLRLNDQQNKFYSESNGFKQQEIQTEIQKTLYEQDLNKKNLSKAKDELADLEKEARKGGALPGWIAPQ